MNVADHFAFQVSDMERSIEFYTKRLGLSLMFHKVDEAHHEAFAFLELDGGNLELLQSLDSNNRPLPYSPPTIRPPYCPHLALKTEDMDALVLRAREKGVTIVKGPLEAPGLAKWIYLADPDNNVIEYIQWLGGDGALA